MDWWISQCRRLCKHAARRVCRERAAYNTTAVGAICLHRYRIMNTSTPFIPHFPRQASALRRITQPTLPRSLFYSYCVCVCAAANPVLSMLGPRPGRWWSGVARHHHHHCRRAPPQSGWADIFAVFAASGAALYHVTAVMNRQAISQCVDGPASAENIWNLYDSSLEVPVYCI